VDVNADRDCAVKEDSSASGELAMGHSAESMDSLMIRCARHDPRDFAELYSRTAPKLYSVALHIVRRKDRAEDVLQEAYLNIWTHIQDYQPSRGAPLTWMTAIVRNRALDWVRRPNLEQGLEHYGELIETISSGEPEPDAALEASRNRHALAAHLTRLTFNERQAIVLAYTYGLSHGELSRHLNQPLGTVKTWTRRGLQKLRDYMCEAA